MISVYEVWPSIKNKGYDICEVLTGTAGELYKGAVVATEKSFTAAVALASKMSKTIKNEKRNVRR